MWVNFKSKIINFLRMILQSKLLCFVLVLFSFFIAYKVHPFDGSDFRWYWTLGRCVMDGVDPYVASIRNQYTLLHPVAFDIEQMGYPPTTGVVLLPFSLLDFSLGAWLFKVISFLVLVSGIFRLVSRNSVHFSWVLLGLLLLWSPVRWNSSNLQITMLVAGIYVWFIYLVRERRMLPAATLMLLALMLKMSDTLPFIITFAVSFNLRRTFAVICVFSTIFAASFLRVGGLSAFMSWIKDLSDFSHSGNPANAVSPHTLDAGIRIDIAYFLNGVYDGFPNATVLAIGIVLVTICFAYIRIYINSSVSVESLTLTTALGLMPTYHHVYAWIYFMPVFVLAFTSLSIRQLFERQKPLLLLLLYGFTTATNETVKLLETHVNFTSVVIYKTYPSFLAILLASTSFLVLSKASAKLSPKNI
jgi:hypothetical protein